jgi:uncharacterized membrane protein
MTDMQLLLLVYVGSGLLLIGLAIPMIRGRVTPNWIYGFRTPKTVNNPETWYKANAYAGKWLLLGGIVTVVVAALFYRIEGLTVDEYALACAFAILGVLGAGVVQSLRYLKTL